MEETNGSENHSITIANGSDQALSLWASILLQTINSSSRHPSPNTQDQVSDQDNTFLSTILHREGEAEVAGDERVIFMNPFNQAINDSGIGMSVGDYLIGPGLEQLLQHLAENDLSRHGTPPARKEAVAAMPSVKIEETMGCSVCLEELEIGGEATEMPCKHKFHERCILPWLELHSSCPVCRFQIPADESKNFGGGVDSNLVEGSGENSSGNGRGFWMPLLWPFTGWLPGSRQNNDNSAGSQTQQPSESGSNSGPR